MEKGEKRKKMNFIVRLNTKQRYVEILYDVLIKLEDCNCGSNFLEEN